MKVVSIRVYGTKKLNLDNEEREWGKEKQMLVG